MGGYSVELMAECHVESVAGLQRACFPEPFPLDLLWQPRHIRRHLSQFPEGQWVVELDGQVVASCSNMLCRADDWESHKPFHEIVGGLGLEGHVAAGTVLYGIDISVHPGHRRKGLARMLYQSRFGFVRHNKLNRYGTVCRLPGYLASGEQDPKHYADLVVEGTLTDATLTPLLRMGLDYKGVIMDYMEDQESGNAGAILEWKP